MSGQSCATSADCYTDCKLCDGYKYGFGSSGPEDSFCLCHNGTCKQIGEDTQGLGNAKL